MIHCRRARIKSQGGVDRGGWVNSLCHKLGKGRGHHACPMSDYGGDGGGDGGEGVQSGPRVGEFR